VARGDAIYRGGEVLDVRAAILQQVPDALGAVGEQLERVARLHILGENQHRRARMAFSDFLRGLAAPRRRASAAS
jgi:hypothetical protein